MTDNMKLWNAVEPDPAFLKEVKARGGFTTINAQWIKQKATEMWGPIGFNWGLKNCKYDYVLDGSGQIVEVWLEATFFYPLHNDIQGQIEISTDMAYRPGDDCRTKLRTHAISKATGDLGFCHDIYLGRWDDNKHVDSPKKSTRKAPAPRPAPAPVDDDVPWGDPGDPNAPRDNEVTGTIEKVMIKEGTSTRGPWCRTSVVINETWYATFDTNIGADLRELEGSNVVLAFEAGAKGNDVLAVRVA